MKERPVNLTPKEIKDLHDSRFNVLRMVIKPQPGLYFGDIQTGYYHPTIVDKSGEEDAGDEIFGAYSGDGEWGCKCPYGQIGDRLRAGNVLLEIEDIGAKLYGSRWYWMMEVKRIEQAIKAEETP